MKSHTLGLTGDVMLGRLVDQQQREREPPAIWGDLLEMLCDLDGLLINLECCLSTRGHSWRRTHRPFHFRADPGWAIPALEAAEVSCCTLANNHVLDFEEPALQDTLDELAAAGIETVGAGMNLDEALEPASFYVGETTVAVIACTDNTPEYAADEDSPGVAYVQIDPDNPQTRARALTMIDRALDSDPNILIASLHWGPNMVETPSSAFESFGRWLIDHGVDLVHGHSAHIFQGIEIVRDRPILYDTGDFVDDYRIDPELRNDRSFLFELTIENRHPTQLRLRPTEIRDCQVKFADKTAAEWSRYRMLDLCGPYGTHFEQHKGDLILELPPP